MTERTERENRALITLHDLGTRDGATASSVRRGMLKEGFTNDEIRKAVETMAGEC